MDWEAATPTIALGIAVAAIVVPAIQQERRTCRAERERKLEAQCLATALRFALRELATTLSHAKLGAVAGSTDQTYQHIGPVQILFMKVQVPSVVLDSTPRIHLLGYPAGPTMLRLIAVMNAYNEAVEKRSDLSIANPGLNAAEHWRAITGFVDDVSPVVAEALKQLDPIADNGR